MMKIIVHNTMTMLLILLCLKKQLSLIQQYIDNVHDYLEDLGTNEEINAYNKFKKSQTFKNLLHLTDSINEKEYYNFITDAYNKFARNEGYVKKLLDEYNLLIAKAKDMGVYGNSTITFQIVRPKSGSTMTKYFVTFENDIIPDWKGAFDMFVVQE